MPQTVPMIERARPATASPVTNNASRMSPSPTTPPSPAGNGQAALRGRHAAAPAASSMAKIQIARRMRSR